MTVEITYPGVYVEEITDTVKPIAGVPTSIAAFAGWTSQGPVDEAVLVRSWTEFESMFGGLDTRALLGYSVRHFFDNGGRDAYIVRITSSTGSSDVLQPNSANFENALLPRDPKGGLYSLDRIDLFNILCVPGETDAAAVARLQKFCRDRRAFLIVDCDQSATVTSMMAGPGNISGADSANSAFYFPWVLAPGQNISPREFPPCGFVAGVYARTDSNRGVWKAPAGLETSLRNVSGLAANKSVTDSENGVMNPKAVNCIRTFPGQGTVVWGARTLQGADQLGSEWKYVPVGRTSLFIEESIDRGLEWVVFEPNGEPLWAKIRLNVGEFLHDLFRRGAFQGSTPKDAYFVKCDRATTTQGDIDSGVVNILVGFAPLKPAEFVVIKLQKMTSKENSASKKESSMSSFIKNAARFDPYKNFKFRVMQLLPGSVIGTEESHGIERFIEQLRDNSKPGADAGALFVGAKGTGKTVAAELIAKELGLDLHRVDLSELVSEYIGETEKNLQRLFDEAQHRGALLFFDEADALFGKRSEVKDAHDRYANIEVSYLLDRLKDYPGVAILATNRKESIDPAFLRRLRFVIDFPFPSAERE